MPEPVTSTEVGHYLPGETVRLAGVRLVAADAPDAAGGACRLHLPPELVEPHRLHRPHRGLPHLPRLLPCPPPHHLRHVECREEDDVVVLHEIAHSLVVQLVHQVDYPRSGAAHLAPQRCLLGLVLLVSEPHELFVNLEVEVEYPLERPVPDMPEMPVR